MSKKSGAYSRRKGHSFEREVAIKLRGVFPKARRHLENHEDDAREGVDLIGTGSYCFQLKKLKRYAPINDIKQVKKRGTPVLVTAGDREEVMAVIPFTHLVYLLDLEKRALEQAKVEIPPELIDKMIKGAKIAAATPLPKDLDGIWMRDKDIEALLGVKSELTEPET